MFYDFHHLYASGGGIPALTEADGGLQNSVSKPTGKE